MSAKLTRLLVAAVVTAVLLPACSGTQESRDLVAEGRRIAEEKGCQACHTPKVTVGNEVRLDSTRAFAGHPEDDQDIPFLPEDKLRDGYVAFNRNQTCWVGPWGVTFARNLTPDPETGIGSWDEASFIQAMRTSTHAMAAGKLVRPMPYAKVGTLRTEELRALFAYLRSLPPIQNRVPPPVDLETYLRMREEAAGR